MIGFACPQCKRPLAKAGQEYECSEHGRFGARQGVPCLIAASPQPSATYFEEHWATKSGADYPPSKLQVAREFLVPSRMNPGPLFFRRHASRVRGEILSSCAAVVVFRSAAQSGE